MCARLRVCVRGFLKETGGLVIEDLLRGLLAVMRGRDGLAPVPVRDAKRGLFRRPESAIEYKYSNGGFFRPITTRVLHPAMFITKPSHSFTVFSNSPL